MIRNKIYILKNYTLEGEVWPALKNIHIPPQLVNWGIIINASLYYFGNENGVPVLYTKSFDYFLFDKSYEHSLYNTGLDVDISYRSHEIITNLFNEVLKKHKDDSTQEIQTKLVESLIGEKLDNPFIICRIIGEKFYTESNSKIIDEEIEKSSRCTVI